jgi:hypothetical protein
VIISNSIIRIIYKFLLSVSIVGKGTMLTSRKIACSIRDELIGFSS